MLRNNEITHSLSAMNSVNEELEALRHIYPDELEVRSDNNNGTELGKFSERLHCVQLTNENAQPER